MVLVFTDTLHISDSTGFYSLMANVNGSWVTVHSVTGPSSGAMDVGTSINTIDVDTSIFIPGQVYEFKWVDSIGNESNLIHIRIPEQLSVTAYTEGIGHIDFIHDAGDAYHVTWYIVPDSFNSLSGATITSYKYTLNHWVNGNKTQIDIGTKTGNYTVPVSGLGAGVYQLQCSYNCSDNTSFIISRTVKTDANGNILIDFCSNGITINSTNGQFVTVTAHFTQTGSNYPIRWGAFTQPSSIVLVGTGVQTTFIAPANINLLLAVPWFDYLIENDYSGDVPGVMGVSVKIS